MIKSKTAKLALVDGTLISATVHYITVLDDCGDPVLLIFKQESEGIKLIKQQGCAEAGAADRMVRRELKYIITAEAGDHINYE